MTLHLIMKKLTTMSSYIAFSLFLLLTHFLTAQNSEPVLVKAGTRVTDYFPFNIRYRYQDFADGKAVSKNGTTNSARFNYNFLSGEMEFIRSADTLIIANKKDIKYITVAQDTFYYRNGYLEIIRSGSFRVFLNQNIVIKDIRKEGAFGTINRTAASESYSFLITKGFTNDLVPDEDWLLQNTPGYYFSTPAHDYLQFTRKNILLMLPAKKDLINKYLKANKVDFKSRDDLLKLADFLDNLMKQGT